MKVYIWDSGYGYELCNIHPKNGQVKGQKANEIFVVMRTGNFKGMDTIVNDNEVSEFTQEKKVEMIEKYGVDKLIP